MKRQIALLSVLICGAPLALRAGELNIGVNLAVPVPQAEIVTRETPPPPVAEQIYAAPGPDFVWIGGHWAWHRHWLWIRGHWEHPRPGLVWASGRWEKRPAGFVWVEGCWAAPQPQVVVAGPPAPPPVAGGVEVVILDAPPPVIVERPGPGPGPDFFWIEGRWAWRGGWVWMRGHYERHPHWHPGGGWVAGHWEARRGGHVWIEGSWR